MGDSLRDQLLKAGLVNEKQAKRAKHEQRVGHKKQGRPGVEAERAAREARAQAELAARREADQTREAERIAGQAGQELARRVAQIVESGSAGKGMRGPRRYYFLARGERLPYLDVSDAAEDKLARGQLAIVESPSGEVSLIDADAARRVAELDAEWLRVFRSTTR